MATSRNSATTRPPVRQPSRSARARYSLEDVADTLRRDAEDLFIGDIAEILGFWNVPFVKDEKVLTS